MIYDAIIVGAGPAGGMAARQISKKGYKVLVIDKKREVGMPVQCAEGITHFALEDTGLKVDESWVKKRIKGIKVMLSSGKFFYAEEPGYSIDRAKFDQWMMNKALDDGCKLLTNTRAQGIIKKRDIWNIKTNAGELKGRILIGADGPASNVAKWLGLLKRREYLKAIQYKFDAEDIDYPGEEWFYIYYSKSFKGGYGWVFPRGNEYNIGVGGLGSVKELLGQFCKSLDIDVGKRKTTNAGILPFDYKLSSLTKDTAMIVGDAAGMTNPVSGGGIHAAVASGRISGETAVKALETENLNLIPEYEKRIRKEPYLDPILLKCAKYFMKWDDDDWNFLGEILDGRDQSELTMFNGFLKMLKHPKYFARSRELLLIRKAMRINQKYGW